MSIIAKGREATVHRDGNRAIWIGDRPDFHLDSSIGWALCQVKLSPPHFPAVHSISFRKHLRVVMEFIEGDALLVWSDAQSRFILDLLKAANIFHRDIRPPNIIVRPNGDWCLVDFGWACSYDDPYPAPKQVGGKYRSPEGPDDAYAMQMIRRELR